MFCSRCGTEVQDTAKFCPSCGLDLAATTPLAAIRDPSDDTEVSVVKNALKEEYEIVQELGRGGMAIVYKAREKQLERDVAIKVLPFSLAFDAEFVERFQREARTAAKLEHPNIIPIYRVGRSGRVIYFVMKFLRGESLSERLEKHGSLPPEEIRRILSQTGQALGYAHRNGIVHRDIKPDNIMFDESGHSIVTDFGIAKAATGTRLTGTGMSIGTPHYMSPEQARAQPLDGRSDIYSLGVVAYLALVGEVPFDGEDSFAIGYKHIMEELPEPPLKSGEARSLFEIIKRMMAKSPDERFQNADELVAALEGTGTGVRGFTAGPASPVTVAPSRPPGMPGTVASPRTPTTPIPGVARSGIVRGPRQRVRKKKRSGVLVGMLTLLILGGGGAGGYWYFFLDAQWPLPFMAGGEPIDSSGNLEGTLLVGMGDSGTEALEDTSAAEDSTVATPEPRAEPLPSTGTLVLKGLPRGAQVQIDGSLVESDSFELEPRTYKIEVERTGYEKYETSTAVGRGQNVVLQIDMQRVAEPPPTPPVTQPPAEANPGVDICSQNPPTSIEYFRSRTCFDTPPRELRAPVVTAPAGFQGTLAPVQVLVKVSVNGNAMLVVGGRRQTAAAELQIAARHFAKDSLQYQPARKDGQPIEAWWRVTVQFRPRP
jgi:tRNA A-37 threonylcarbamoyl transferase component Bud32